MIDVNLGGGVQLQLTAERAAELHRQLEAALQAGEPAPGATDPVQAVLVLPDGHPMWAQHSGGEGHHGPEWDPDTDLPVAEAFYGVLAGKTKVFLDLLIDHPGQLLTPEQLGELSGGLFTSSRSVAGTINGLLRPRERSGRRYPFSWWSGDHARYAMKPSVAALFAHARHTAP